MSQVRRANRLDLLETYCQTAKAESVLISINSDAQAWLILIICALA